jgi:outer membrane protein OmpA-like peptidoglycan-associated protein
VIMRRLTKLSVLLAAGACLVACASSNVERTSAHNVDMGVQNAKNLVGDADGDLSDAYQNSTQASKGAMLGGTAGGIAGSFMSGIGFIPGAFTGALLGGSYGGYIDSETTLGDQLENRGANVITLGDQIMVVMNSSRLFNGMTPDLKPSAYSTLDVLAQYINSYTKMLVKVTAYTDSVGQERVNQVISQKQAEAITKYLTAMGVNARLLVAEGAGGTSLIAKNQETWGDSDNYRIEITLEKLQA